MAEKKAETKPRPRCPICDRPMNKPFFHFYWSHSKWEIVKLVIKLLKLEGVAGV